MRQRDDDIVSATSDIYKDLLSSSKVITLAIRTPLTKARKGGLKDAPLDELLTALLKV